MGQILDHVGKNPIFLECTRKDNIGFYERHGFEVVEEVELVDEKKPGQAESIQYWVMVRK